MKGQRRDFPSSFKAKVAIEALKETHSLAKLSEKYQVHANMVSTWKKTCAKARESCSRPNGGAKPSKTKS
jgi:transposase-like protein